MTAGQLGGRIGMRPQSVLDLEKSEIAGTVQLNTLRKAAAALDCTLVYALVPNSTLDAYVMTRAREVARRELARVDHSMALEDQGLSDAEREARLEDYVREYIRTSGIWDAV
jgi:predicted DNA-binding mobile mystery protein A